MADNEAPVAVDMRGITKRFPGVLANDQVDFAVRQGEIHALLGENGAGKSTLMSALCGLYQPDEGAIYLVSRRDQTLRPARISSPRDAIERGIGMVHQHFKLVRSQTVAENIILGLDGTPFRLSMRAVERRIADLAKQYHLPVDPRAYIWQLSVGEQQRVEILKVLYRGAEILILDEPTAVLTPQEADELGQTMRQMASEGKAIVFISHKLDEVMSFADRVTVLRDGTDVATVSVAETSKAELARLMVGREVLFRVEKDAAQTGAPVLDMNAVTANNDKGLPALHGISLDVRSGEIVGVAGVAGNGQRELAEVVTGLRPATGGRIKVADRDLTNRSPLTYIEAGVAHIPGDRLGMGLAGNLPVSDNLIMKAYRREPLAAGPFLADNAVVRFARRVVEAFNVQTPSVQTPARNLSGGNQQKAILGREIMSGKRITGDVPALMVAVYPTRGLDVGAIEAVREALLKQRQEGAAIPLISEDLDELQAMSDRIAVIHSGEIMGIVAPDEVDVEQLGLMMAGERSE
ncbi:MAG: ABC transporter ATP-binding protein [Candidatus Promineifilaceae bacterium]|nr:ABC transporter ATP-binding protein [Candidatus Promineifilaceae bacterium]